MICLYVYNVLPPQRLPGSFEDLLCNGQRKIKETRFKKKKKKKATNPKNPAHNCVFNPKYERFYSNTPSTIKPLGLRILPLLEQANISIKNVQSFPLPSKEPWTQNPPKVILDLHKNKKSEVDSHIFKTEFLEIKSTYKHYISIYTDGSKQDEKVACAVISPTFMDSIRLPDNSSIFTAEAKAIDIARYHIRDQLEKQFIIYSDIPDNSSIFTAEAKAIDIALYHIRDQLEKQFIIYSDSLSVLRSLKNLDHRNPLIQQIFRKYNYLSFFKEFFFVGFQATLTFLVTNLLIWKLNLLYHYRSPT